MPPPRTLRCRSGSLAMPSQYRENLLDHARRPRCFGVLENASFVAHQANPSCGDAIDLSVKIVERVDGVKVVDEVKFSGVGCVISLAASSLFAESLRGKAIEEILALEAPDMVRLLGTEISPMRVSCATLPLVAFRRGVELWKKA